MEASTLEKNGEYSETVKIYNPRKKARASDINGCGAGTNAGDSSGALSPRPEYGVVEMEGGVMMTTSEILDFSEGADSYSGEGY